MKQTLQRLLRGALIGAGAILPGVSGGVLCVVLGIYEPMMALLAHPWQGLKERWRFFLPILLGFAVGVLILSRGTAWLFRASPVPAVWLFVGLIAGTLPSLWREAGHPSRPVSAWIAGCVAFALVLTLLLSARGRQTVSTAPGLMTWFVCGMLWGIGFIAPGLSPSSLFIFMGVYQPMSEGIAALDTGVLLPMAAGMLLCIAVLSRGMTVLLRRLRPQTLMAILGCAAASTVVIVPGLPIGLADWILNGLCLGLGIVIASRLS